MSRTEIHYDCDTGQDDAIVLSNIILSFFNEYYLRL